MFRRSIVYKLNTGYILIALISTLIIGAIFINFFRDYTLESRRKNMLQKANEISNMIGAYISDSQGIDRYNDVFKLIESLVNARVWIADRDGNILAMSSSSRADGIEASYTVGQYDSELMKQVLSGQEVVKESYNTFYEESMLTAAVPVKNSTNSIDGMVLLHTPLSGIASIMDDAFNILLLTILLVIILSGLLSHYFSRFIAKPLKLMNRSAVEMTNGNYKVRTDIYRKDEIGELGSSLDMLAVKLDYTIGRLSEEKNKLNDLFLSMSEGILAFDINMKLINHNKPAQMLMGYTSGNLNMDILMQDLKSNGLAAEFHSVISDGRKRTLVKNMNNSILRFSISPVKNNLNKIAGVVVLIQDISRQEKLEQMRKDFIANVSHEFRTPLTLIKGSIESLIDGAVPDRNVGDLYSRLLDETDRLQRMVNDLLDLSKLQSGRMNLHIDKLDLTAIISDVSRTMQFMANKKQIRIELDLAKDMPPVLGDYDRVKQLIIIFIDNAIKYSHDKGIISISTYIKNYACIEIKDNGIGIPDEDLPYIWDRFYKADKSRGGSKSGTGLGLAIAKHIVEILGGTVSIESKRAVGTTIKIGLTLSTEV